MSWGTRRQGHEPDLTIAAQIQEGLRLWLGSGDMLIRLQSLSFFLPLSLSLSVSLCVCLCVCVCGAVRHAHQTSISAPPSDNPSLFFSDLVLDVDLARLCHL
jgi:hypothetical protein